MYDSCIGKEIGERRLKQSADKVQYSVVQYSIIQYSVVQYSVEKHLSHGSGKKDG